MILNPFPSKAPAPEAEGSLAAASIAVGQLEGQREGLQEGSGTQSPIISYMVL